HWANLCRQYSQKTRSRTGAPVPDVALPPPEYCCADGLGICFCNDGVADHSSWTGDNGSRRNLFSYLVPVYAALAFCSVKTRMMECSDFRLSPSKVSLRLIQPKCRQLWLHQR